MAEPAPGILEGDGIEGRTDLLVDSGDRARLGGAQQGLELGPARLDRRQVGGVARQGQQREAGALQQDTCLRDAMGGEVVHHDGGSRLVPAQSGDQDLLQKGLKHGPIGGDSNRHDGDKTAEPECAEHSEAAPMTGRAATGALAARRARIKPRQLGADAGRVEKDEVLGRDALDLLGKACPWQGTGGGAFGNDIGTLLLTRPERLFLRRKPRCLRVMQSTGRLTLTPVCAASRAQYSAKVASLSAATNWRSTSHSAVPKRGAGPRPSGLATRRPSVRPPAPNSSLY